MNKLPNCVLKYMTDMLPTTDRFNLSMVDKHFNKIIKHTIDDHKNMIINSYKLKYYKVRLIEKSLYYVACDACKNAVIQESYEKCRLCDSIMCNDCVQLCLSCDKSTNYCINCDKSQNERFYRGFNHTVSWCDTCAKQCELCRDIIICPFDMKTCTDCGCDFCCACSEPYDFWDNVTMCKECDEF